jgi:hypothetical protein
MKEGCVVGEDIKNQEKLGFTGRALVYRHLALCL